ncbi:MAG: hypothetical protein ABWZ42_09160 [Ilumatobacteraceae bacterium]
MLNQFKFTEPFDTPLFDKEALAALAGKVEAANERVLEFVVDASRRLADLAVASADRAADVLPVALPFADRLPTPAESAASYLDFVERAATVNREFNQRVVALLTVDAPAVVDTVAESVSSAPTAKKTAAKKTAARKTAARKTAAKKTAAKKTAATSSATSN